MKPCWIRRASLAMVAVAAIVAVGNAAAAGPALYDTGPAQDSAFVRFVNGTGQKLEVVSGKARLPLDVGAPVSQYLSVRPDTEIKGGFEASAARGAVAIQAKPGAFATIVALVSAGQKDIIATVVTETPDDFNSLKASLAFYNLDSGCKTAGLRTVGKNVAVFSSVAQGAMQRRAINAVPQLSLQATCDGQSRGAALQLGGLKAGERYSVLWMPAPAAGDAPYLLLATDSIAR